jgi:hypothetical protein
VSALVVHAPQDSIDGDALSGVSVRDLADPSTAVRTASFGHDRALSPGAARRLEIVLHGTADIEPGLVPPPAWRPWPKLRRVVTEVRDRAIAQTGSGPRSAAGPETAGAGEESQRWAA